MNFLPFEPKLLIVLRFVVTLIFIDSTNVATFCESDPLTNTVLDPDVSPTKPSPLWSPLGFPIVRICSNFEVLSNYNEISFNLDFFLAIGVSRT